MAVQSADGLLLAAVKAAVSELGLRPEDAAAVKLAEKYAEWIDGDPERLEKTGARLLDVLTALGATPAARAKLKGGQQPGATEDPLARLRAARRA